MATEELGQTVEGGQAPINASQAKYAGLARVIGAEQPELRCRLIDLERVELNDLPDDSQNSLPNDSAQPLFDFLTTETTESQFAVRGGQFLVPRLKPVKRKTTAEKLQVDSNGSYLITGGLGALGRQAGKWLSDKGAGQIVLVSRRTPDQATQDFLDQINESGCQAIVASADFGDRVDVQSLLSRFGDDLMPLKGVIHAAGVLEDGLIADQTWERFEKVLSPKIIGASLLHEATQDLELDFFVLYSSVASVLGSRGQSNYALANAYLDGLAWHRRALGLPGLAINWGPWAAGMADDPRIVKQMALQGITPLGNEEAHDVLEKMITGDLTQTTVIDVDWRRMMMGLGGESPSLLEGLAPSRKRSGGAESAFVAKLKKLKGPARRESLRVTVSGLLQEILSTDGEPENDRPLIEMGLDSLMAVEFGTELQMLMGDSFTIAPTMLFDHHTIDAITDHVLELVEQSGQGSPAEADSTGGASKKAAVGDEVDNNNYARTAEDIAIVGLSCRFPGARNADEFWENLLGGVDSVCDIPSDRWDVDKFYSAERQPGKMVTRSGGFIDDIGDFDAPFFNVSAEEACWIDPQHRMLLEHSYRAIEHAGICPHPLVDNKVGVFMGIMGQDYAFLPKLDNPEIVEAFQGAGLSHSAGVGRISYHFGFEGPSVAVDTASSSSLVALYQAMRSLQEGACNMALAGGVNAILAPVNSLLMSKAGLLSPEGRCKSFSATADGFGRGEGCGVVVLKRLLDHGQ
jgi:acyl carrier protein